MSVLRHTPCFGKIKNGLHAKTLVPLTSTRRALPRTHRNTSTVKVRARLDPYKTLGVSHDADEKEIKRAHRRLVLEHHPDRHGGKEGVEVKFLAIQEAYEILTGKRRGKEVDSGPASGWDFHDWFWRFKFSRRQGAAGGARAQAPPPPEEVRQRLREQLSGLKAKAAAKRAAGPRHTAHAAHARNPSEAAASSVWRSTTKNARTTQQKPTENAAHTAFASKTNKKQERLHAEAEFASTKATAVKEEMPFEGDISGSPINSTTAASAASNNPSSSTSTTTSAEEHQAWRSLITRAVHVAHSLHHRHHHSVSTHAQRIQSHISSIGSKLSQKLQLHALHELMPELTNSDTTNNNTSSNFGHWTRPGGFRFSASASIGNAFGSRNRSATAGVPSENELHMLFSTSLHHNKHHHHEKQHSSAGSAAATAVVAESMMSQDDVWQEYPPIDAHSRKFADKEHVKSRLTNQLTGLKRRSALKKEFDADLN